MALKTFVPNNNDRAIAYYRYSSTAQNEMSIDQQRDCAHIYADAHGYRIVEEYIDTAKTGTNENRPDYQRMLQEVKQLKPAALILWKTDRLGRDKVEVAIAKKKIRDAGCKVLYVSENIDTETPEGALLEGILEEFSELYVRQLSQNVKRGMTKNAKEGLANGRPVFGYMIEDKRYKINPETAPVLQKIFADYASGVGMQQIVNDLNQQGIRSTKGNKFTINSIRHILHNEAYIGMYRYADIEYPGGFPVLVSNDLFQKVQDRMIQNKRNASKGKNNENSTRCWLTGKLFCGKCGCPMTGTHGTGKLGRKYYYYRCRNVKEHTCDKKNVPKEKIEAIVAHVLSLLVSDDQNSVQIAADATAYYKKNYADTHYLEGLKARLKDVEKGINNIVVQIEKGRAYESLLKRLDELEEQKKALTETIEVETAKTKLTQDEHSIAAYFQKYDGADMTNEAIRDEVLNYFIDKIYVYDDQLVFTGGYYGRDGQWHSKVIYDDVWREVKFEGFESFAVGLTKQNGAVSLRLICSDKVRQSFFHG